MKLIAKEINKGRLIITTRSSYCFIFKRVRKFIAWEIIINNHSWEWYEIPRDFIREKWFFIPDGFIDGHGWYKISDFKKVSSYRLDWKLDVLCRGYEFVDVNDIEYRQDEYIDRFWKYMREEGYAVMEKDSKKGF